MSKELLQDIIKDFNPDKFVRFFRDKNRAFAPRSEDLSQYDDDNFRNGLKFGEIKFAQDEKMLICAFEASQPLSERSGKKAQYEKGKKILKDSQSDAGIFIFYDTKGNFRFSLIYANYLGRRRDWSAFRRFTYFVSPSPSETNKTFLQQIGEGDFSSLEKIKDAFSVEKVTKKFYTEIANWYFWALKEAKFSVDAESEQNGRNIALIRLITRLIFIWFMRQKGIIKKELFDRRFLESILKELSPQESTYYKAILQNLFFATLNTPIEQRKFRREERYKGYLNKDYMNPTYFRSHSLFKDYERMKELFNDIPFLNGGLFECLDKSKDDESNDTGKEIRIDGFSDDPKKQPHVPNFLFFSDEKEVNLNEDYGTKNKRYRTKGIINILASYNFTIDENTPVDEEIALDPELLGRVFENLLASYNPETATTARKATGSYYTPREIVDYMVKESLKEYFKTQVTNINEENLKAPFLYDDNSNLFNEKTTEQLINAIHNLKLLDPAVGSGAFPMGALHALVHILHKLDPHNEKWKAEQIKAVSHITDPKIRQETLERIEESFTLNELDYGRKLYLIQNCIYGVDIQPIAIQIAKLRFFISLLVDERVDRTKPNSGIEPLPNLETKFVSANTLIGLPRAQQLSLKSPNVQRLERELMEIRSQYFIATNTKEKEKLKKKDAEKRKALAQSLKNSGFPAEATEKIASWNPYDTNKSADWFDPEWMFGIASNSPLIKGDTGGCGGFDIVIANPPYGFRNVLSAEEKQFFRKTMNIEFPTGDVAELFIVISLSKLVRQNGELTFIIPKKSLYGESWSNVRKIWLENDLHFLMDASQAFENVLLEQNAFSVQKQNCSDGKIAVGALDSYARAVQVFGNFSLSEIFSSDMRNAQIYRGLYPQALLKKITYNSAPETPALLKAEIGISNITEHLTFEAESNYPCVKGIDIYRYGLKRNIRYLKGKFAKQYLEQYRSEKLVAQEIIAHIQNPIPHIQTTIFYDAEGRLFNDTCVEIKPLNRKLHIKFLLAYLQSSFCNWYAYNFIYNRAVRTMHFINYYVTQIPIPKSVLDKSELQKPFIEIVDKILAITKDDDYLENSAKQAKVRDYERQIDEMVYALYNLTPEEIAIVEGKG